MNIDNGPLLSDYEGFFMAIDSVLLVVDFIHHRTFQSGVFVLMDFFMYLYFCIFRADDGCKSENISLTFCFQLCFYHTSFADKEIVSFELKIWAFFLF